MLLHCFEERVASPWGPRTVDLHELLALTGGRGTVLAVVEAEVLARIPGKAWDEHGRRGFRAVEKVAAQAQRRWRTLLATCERVDPPWSEEDIRAERKRFEDMPRDLSALVSQPKDPVPGPNDLRILAQSRQLGDPPRFLVAKDAHFVGYADLLQQWYGVNVLDALQLPVLMESWRAPSR